MFLSRLSGAFPGRFRKNPGIGTNSDNRSPSTPLNLTCLVLGTFLHLLILHFHVCPSTPNANHWLKIIPRSQGIWRWNDQILIPLGLKISRELKSSHSVSKSHGTWVSCWRERTNDNLLNKRLKTFFFSVWKRWGTQLQNHISQLSWRLLSGQLSPPRREKGSFAHGLCHQAN